MQTPVRRPLRPINRTTPSSAPHPSINTSKPTRHSAHPTTTKPSRIPALTPHPKPRPPRTAAQPAQPGAENRPPSHAAPPAGAPAVGAGGAAGGRRARRQVMRLSELMAAVRMTPIKEREEEEGLGDAEVVVDCGGGGGDSSARKRTVEQQEEEIRQWEAMLRLEEEEKQRDESGPQTADCFHTASELDFELTELQQLSVADDGRRSSLFAVIPLPTQTEWSNDEQAAPPAQDDAAVNAVLPASDAQHEGTTAGPDESEIELQKPRTVADIDTDEIVEGSEIELQRPNKLAAADDQRTESPLPTSNEADDCDSGMDVQPSLVSRSPAEQDELLVQPSEPDVSDEQLQLESHNAEEVGSVGEEQQETATASVAAIAVAVHVFELETPLDEALNEASYVEVDDCGGQTSTLEQPSFPVREPFLPQFFSAPASALPPCTACSSLFASLQQLLGEQAEKDRQTDAALQKQDDDYKSLYFAYCQLERDHNALKAQQRTEPVHDDEDGDSEADGGDEAEQDVEVAAVAAAVDYAAMSEEKVVPSLSPSHSLLDQLTAELQQLELDKAAAEAQVETKMAAAETEAVELSNKYEQLRTEYSAQSAQLVEALREVDNMKQVRAQLDETQELQMREKEQQIDCASQCILSLEADKQQLATDLQASQRLLDQLHTQLEALDGDKQQLANSLSAQHSETQQLQAQLSEQRDTTEYVQNEKLAVDQELANLHTTHTALLAQQTASTQHYEHLLAHHQHKDADMLSVIDDSIANIEQLRTELANCRLAFARCHHTLLERWDEGLVRDEELYAVRVELQQTGLELAGEAERVIGMAAQLTEADGMRAALESRLRCSEDRVEELTALMATVEQDRKKDQHIHSTLTAQLAEADHQLDEQRSKARDLTKQVRLAEDRSVRLEGDISSHQQKQVRLQSELQRERDERRREMERRRETEAQLEQLQQHAATLEGQQEALTQSIQLRPLWVTDEYERRLRDKEALILRLGKTVKQMHRHIEVDVAQREADMARSIRQMQRLFVLVVTILSKPQYAEDSDVRRLLEVLEREGAAIDAKGKEEAKDRPDSR